jgi:hypothetical protein
MWFHGYPYHRNHVLHMAPSIYTATFSCFIMLLAFCTFILFSSYFIYKILKTAVISACLFFCLMCCGGIIMRLLSLMPVLRQHNYEAPFTNAKTYSLQHNASSEGLLLYA